MQRRSAGGGQNSKCRKVVKGVKAVDFLEVTEWKPNIFFKIWRVYPVESDTLNLDHKDLPRGALTERAFAFGAMG
jgi:hypothetical protein